jgi:NAD(P)-dependent dehydrogenase (short-subunit alcohol dehydrogenase family)
MDVLEDRAATTVDLVAAKGGSAISVQADTAVEADVERTVRTALDEFGRIDIMWANAGIISRGGVPSVMGGEHLEFQDFPLEDWHNVMAVNLTGPFLCAKHAGAPVVGQSYEETAGAWDPSVSPIPLKLNRPPSLLDNAYAALYPVSDEAAYVTGVTLPSTDGGTLARVAIQFEKDIPHPSQ